MKKILPFAAIAALITFFLLTDSQSWAETVATKSKVCPTAAFPDLSKSAGAGANYAKPALSVTCTTTELQVASNGMISFAFEPKTPNALTPQEWKWSVPLNPVKAKSTTTIKNVLGTLGFTVSGLPIYGPTEGPQPIGQQYGDPVYNKIMDTCGGHTGPAREYHHHAITLVQQCNLKKQKILGYALDGFPIYTTLGCVDKKCTKTATMKSGYVQTGNPTTNSWDAYTYKASKATTTLDACNGRTQPDGTYGYHATTAFPYIIGCFTGTATLPTGRAGEPMPPMGGPQQPKDGVAPPKDGPLPPKDGPLPPKDGPLPPKDGPLPPKDGPQPPKGGPVPPKP
jgi:hypothetical protein